MSSFIFLYLVSTKNRVKSSFLTYKFAFQIDQSFFSTFYLFPSFMPHVDRSVILRIPQCRTANRSPVIFCSYISNKDTFLHFWLKPYPGEKPTQQPQICPARMLLEPIPLELAVPCPAFWRIKKCLSYFGSDRFKMYVT